MKDKSPTRMSAAGGIMLRPKTHQRPKDMRLVDSGDDDNAGVQKMRRALVLQVSCPNLLKGCMNECLRYEAGRTAVTWTQNGQWLPHPRFLHPLGALGSKVKVGVCLSLPLFFVAFCPTKEQMHLPAAHRWHVGGKPDLAENLGGCSMHVALSPSGGAIFSFFFGCARRQPFGCLSRRLGQSRYRSVVRTDSNRLGPLKRLPAAVESAFQIMPDTPLSQTAQAFGDEREKEAKRQRGTRENKILPHHEFVWFALVQCKIS